MIENFDLTEFPNFVKIHRHALVESPELLGYQTIVWAFARLFMNVRTGECCRIGTGTYIGQATVLGDHVRVGDSVHITDHMTIGNHVFVSPHTVFCNDKGIITGKIHSPTVQDNVSIGVNATILPGVVLGAGCVIGAGSVVTKDVPAGQTWVGNPAHPIWDSEGDETTLRDFT